MNQQDIEQVVKAVLLKMKDSSQPAGTVHDVGVFASLDDAVAAATVAQQGLKRVAMRQQVIQAIREAGEKYARELAELAVTETGMGRVEDKFAKNVAQARGTPGVECLTPQVLTGDNGLTLIENAPWGVVASVTPSTNPAATVINNGTVAKLAMRQPFVLFKGLTFQKLCLPGAFRPGDHHNKMLRPGLCVVHASPQYL